MKSAEVSIKRKIVVVMTTTTITVLAFTIAAFMMYELLTFRGNMVANLSIQARIVADNSSGALAFKNEKDAREVLASLRAESQIVAAALYDNDGKIFVTYPEHAPIQFPKAPEERGHAFHPGELVVFEPVFQENARQGTLYLKADLRSLNSRLRTYAGLAVALLIGSGIFALILSNRLQKRISDPVLALARTARAVSEARDYSVRATKVSEDELGFLTDAFNQMLTRIQEQTLAIQESESRLRLALGASRTGTWDWDLNTGRITWDDYLLRLFGLKPGEFEGTYAHFERLVHPDDRATVKRAVDQALAGKQEFAIEYRVIWPDGSTHNLAARGRGFFDTHGRPVRMSGVCLDITERMRSEEAGRRLAAIVEFSEDAIVSKDLNGIIASWNKGAEALFGYAPSEAIGQPITLIIPDDRHDEEMRILEGIRHGERIPAFETVRRRKDGTLLNVSVALSPLKDAEGRIIGASKIARDISERIRSREALERQARVLAEQAQMLDLANVLVRDLDDRIILWNTGMEKMYGWLRSETLARVSHEVLQTRSSTPLEEIKAMLLSTGKWEGELTHVRKDGMPIIVASQWVLHRDNHGRPTAILEVNTDITERKRAEQQILGVNVELEKRVRERTGELMVANQELEAFTYSVAHDLRAPLRHIDAFTKIIFDDFADELPPEARRYLENIRRGSQSMSRLVDDLLNLARLGRQELRRELTPLKPLVEEVINDLKRETANRQIEWRIGRLPALESDPGLMKQIFANLLSNAVKYTRPRKPAVIEIGQREIGDQLVIYVRDNGVGFNMKYADKLFGVFQRLHRADEFEGTGVGLATVDRIIRKHGGHIWAESEINQGATFYFTLNGLDKAAQAA